MQDSPFEPIHINATSEDLAGNNGIGRYVFLPGSDGRAKEIAKHFSNLSVKSHTRGHHLYLGSLPTEDGDVAVAAISSGMGCPSMEIILHELFHLGAKRFLRIGTSGSLQPNRVKLGDIVNAMASVRDEGTSRDYMPIEIPALASLDMILAVVHAAEKLRLKIHTGIVHCKSSLYAREFGVGPRSDENNQYIKQLAEYDVLASEMETATLFTQTQIYHHQLAEQGQGPNYRVLAGAILGVISVATDGLATVEQQRQIEDHIIQLALEAVKILSLERDVAA